MFTDDPFHPEIVEKQIADIVEELQSNHLQYKARDVRLIEDLQQVYQDQSSNKEAIEYIKGRVLQGVNQKVSQPDKMFPLFGRATPSPRGTDTSRQRNNRWHLYLLAAILLVGLLSFTSFALFHQQSSPAQIRKGSLSPNGHRSGSLNIVIEPQSVFYQSNVYVISDRDIRAYTARNGDPGRTYALSNIGTPTIIDGVLYVSTLTTTYSVRISDGKLLWQAPFGSAAAIAPEVKNDVLYGSTGTDVYALRTSDGKLLWQYRTNNQNESFYPPVVVQGAVYFSSSLQKYQSIDAHIYALDRDSGKPIWNHIVGHSSISSLKVDGNVLYIFIDGFVTALQAEDGSTLWQHQLPNLTQLEITRTTLRMVTNGIIYIAAGNGVIYALQTTHGDLLWSYRTSQGTLFSSFSFARNTLYFSVLAFSKQSATRISTVVALRANDGHQLWQYQLGGPELVSPTVGPGIIYVVALAHNYGKQNLYALRADNGTLIWQRAILSQ